ncbi:MAG: glycosyltransferase family 9 protein, partial [Candidatus Omnitrophica bacterium]|nr:glycosyltransferase family 9 protein [Candidatus Omnitrophota bacterium]
FMQNIGKKILDKILLIRTDRFGEFILNIPAFRVVREEFPDSHIAVMVQPYAREIIEGNPDVNEIITYNSNKQKGIWQSLKLICFLREKKFDLVIIFNPSKKFNIITFFAGIPKRVGYNRKWGFLLTHKIEDKKYLGEKHEVEYNLDLVQAAGCKLQATSKEKRTILYPISYILYPIQISLKKEDEEFIERQLTENDVSKDESLLAIHPFTSNPKKQWAIENFVELAHKISQWKKTKVVIIGGKDERELSRKYFVNINVIDWTGELSLRQTAVLLKRCKLLISCDSGPVHLAAAVETPAAVIFRSGISGVGAKRWGPWGKGHIIEKENLDQISVEEVLKAVQQILNK